MKIKQTTKSFTNSKGDVWEWTETPELIKAINQLNTNHFSDLESQAPDYGIGK